MTEKIRFDSDLIKFFVAYSTLKDYVKEKRVITPVLRAIIKTNMHHLLDIANNPRIDSDELWKMIKHYEKEKN